jgi:hypothetical protein
MNNHRHTVLCIEHIVTDDVDGEPWPPPGDRWHLVGPARDGTSLWRRLSWCGGITEATTTDK